MKVRIHDIHREGTPVKFQLSAESVNRRITPSSPSSAKDGKAEKGVRFQENPEVAIVLSLDGRSIYLDGAVLGVCHALCARCAEQAVQPIEVPIDLVLKPQSGGNAVQEDLHFGHYDGEEIDVAGFAEEYLMLGIPFAILCREDCRGLCPRCGGNKNLQQCGCESKEEQETPFSVLKNIKIVQ